VNPVPVQPKPHQTQKSPTQTQKSPTHTQSYKIEREPTKQSAKHSGERNSSHDSKTRDRVPSAAGETIVSSSSSAKHSTASEPSKNPVSTAARLTEIADAVKPFLRPYYKDGKIDKETYKQVLGRSVKDIYHEAGKEGRIGATIAHDTVRRLVKKSLK
jgi:hypothetical protein